MSALADYYAAMANEKNASVPLLGAQTDLAQQQAGNFSSDDAAKRADQFATATLANAQAGTLPVRTAADAALSMSEAGLNNTRTGLLPQTTASDLTTQALQQQQTRLGLGAIGDDVLKRLGGAEKGTSKVKPVTSTKNPNGSPGKTDTVPMMLAPGEAVLNKHAVDHYGGDIIDHMNRMGLLRGKAHKELHTMAMKQLKTAGSKKAAAKAKRRVA